MVRVLASVTATAISEAVSAVTESPVQSSKAVESLACQGHLAMGVRQWQSSRVWQMRKMKAHKINYAPDGDAVCVHICVLHLLVKQVLTMNGMVGKSLAVLHHHDPEMSDLAITITSACVGGFPTAPDTASADPWATHLVCAGRQQTATRGRPPFRCSGSPAPSCLAVCAQEPSEEAL